MRNRSTRRLRSAYSNLCLYGRRTSRPSNAARLLNALGLTRIRPP
jgi:hypothetical protein